MQKRGLSNIEFILSFVLFVGFVIAALYFFNPVRDVKVLESSKSYVIGELTRNTTIELDSYSVKIMPDASGSTSGVIAVNIPGINSTKNTRVEDYDGNKIDSWRDVNNVYFNVKSGDKLLDFAIIKFSEDFTAGSPGNPPSPNTAYYKIASSSSEEVMSEERLRQLNNSHYNDYLLLKKQLGIPTDVDFAFEIEFPNGYKISATRDIPLRAEVFAENSIKEVLREDGTTEFANFMVKIW
jgi:hypothetical protein